MLRSYVKSVMICIAVPNLVTTRDCRQSNQAQVPDNNDLTRLKGQMPSPNPGTDVTTERQRSRCCPYDFDSRFCRTVDDRLLCGYNRNVGRPPSMNNEVSLGDDCRIKGGRVECGYHEPPFANVRRPPAWANMEDNSVTIEDDDSLQVSDNMNSSEISSEKRQKLKYTITKGSAGNDKVRSTVKHNVRRVTRCVEIRDRIVCRDM